MDIAIGIDLGTSACRVCVLDAAGHELAHAASTWPVPRSHQGRKIIAPEANWRTLQTTLGDLATQWPAGAMARMLVDGTSGTLLLADAAGEPLTPFLAYNDQSCVLEAERVRTLAPPDCAAHGTGSSLVKLLHLYTSSAVRNAAHALHQADWVTGKLCGQFGFSDENNALKLGYDAQRRSWPDWLTRTGIPLSLLPWVNPPGTLVGELEPALAKAWNLSPASQVLAGTTDSTAAVIATGVHTAGEAVTSLGSTLVLKVVTTQPVFAAANGIYSQRLGDLWLAGGASNSGGAVLRKYFSDARIRALSEQLQAEQSSGLDYYPLLEPGERFPNCDPSLAPRMEPRPTQDWRFLQGLLEGIANIEADGYARLQQLGAPPIQRVTTVGGGAANTAWQRIRARRLGVPVNAASHQEAAYGAARLALRSGVTAC